MDGSKQKGYCSSSSSSIAVDLFGPKENSSPASSSASIFSSVFGPSPTERGLNSLLGNQGGNAKHGVGGPSNNETISPCHYSSSIYYGGQEVYSTPPTNTKPKNKKDGQDEDSGSSRGNWWQGSVYY